MKGGVIAKIWDGVKTLMQKGLVLKGSALKGVMPKALNLKGLMLRVSKALGFKGVMLKGRMSKTSGINGMMPKGLVLRGMVAAVVMAAGCGEAYGLKGAWRGELDLGRTKLPLVLRFSESEAGETRCTLDSPSQGARGIEMAVELCTADSVALSCEALRARFTGRVMGCLIRGRFEQQGAKLPLNLVPEIVIGERRPQTPKPPYPFSVVDTVFTAADGAVMSATLCMPAEAKGAGVPAVVMVTGSGPQNRDEELMDHRPFAVIADYLARSGIASLRYDDRGTGRSTGDFASATTYTFKDDAVSGIKFLRGVEGIGRVGVLGHSEGGTIALMISGDGEADFAISLAGMAKSGKETLLEQNRRALERMGLSADELDNSLKLIGLCFDAMAEQARRGERRPIDVDSIVRAAGLHVPEPIMASVRATQGHRTGWLDTFVGLNPAEWLGSVRCPVLAINGGKDTQVSPDNLDVIREGVAGADVRLMPGLNHLMQHAVTGEVGEYSEIRETIAPEVLEAIMGFIKQGGDGR